MPRQDTLVPELRYDGHLTDLESSLIRSQEAQTHNIVTAINRLADRAVRAIYVGISLGAIIVLFALGIVAETRGVDSTRVAEATQEVLSVVDAVSR